MYSPDNSLDFDPTTRRASDRPATGRGVACRALRGPAAGAAIRDDHPARGPRPPERLAAPGHCRPAAGRGRGHVVRSDRRAVGTELVDRAWPFVRLGGPAVFRLAALASSRRTSVALVRKLVGSGPGRRCRGAAMGGGLELSGLAACAGFVGDAIGCGRAVWRAIGLALVRAVGSVPAFRFAAASDPGRRVWACHTALVGDRERLCSGDCGCACRRRRERFAAQYRPGLDTRGRRRPRCICRLPGSVHGDGTAGRSSALAARTRCSPVRFRWPCCSTRRV